MRTRGSQLVAARRSAALAVLLGVAAGCGDGGQSGAPIDLLPADGECVVTFSMTLGSDVSVLDFEADHSAFPGSVVADGRTARCARTLASGELIGVLRSDHCDAAGASPQCHRRLLFNVKQERGHEIEAPADLARCLFHAGTGPAPEPAHFEFRIRDASRFDTSPITPPPVLAVTDVDCSGTVVTTSSTTSSTVSACADRVCEEDEACVEGGCVTTDRFEVEVSVTDDLAFGALQLGIRYDAAAGAFRGFGFDVDCRRHPAINGFVLYNHICADCSSRWDDLPILVVGISSVPGFRTPPWLLRCVFQAANDVPTSETFAIELQDASDPEFTPLHPAVVVSAVRPLAPQ